MHGYINRAKVRVRGGEADGAGYELCEIKEAKLSHVDESTPAPPPDSSVKGDLFFCDFREPKASDAARYYKICFFCIQFSSFCSSTTFHFFFLLSTVPPLLLYSPVFTPIRFSSLLFSVFPSSSLLSPLPSSTL